jgi:pimeloyl-ACP methyl ester carboxylesterase
MSEVKYLELHGDRVAYRDSGSGEVLLLIHGMAGSSDTWRAVIPQLAKKYRVVAPDLLGHGRSDKPRGDYSLGAFAVWLRDLLDELGIARATIVGQSLGGGVAMQFVYQHPDYCERLILISSGGLGPDVGWTLRLLSAPGAEFILPVIAPPPILKVGNKLRSWFIAAGIHSPRGAELWSAYSSLSEAQTRQAFLRTLRSVVDYRGQAVSALNRLHLTSDLPTMAIWGDHDQIIPVAHAHAAHSARPGSRVEVLAGVGHFPQVERPTEVVDLIDDFIATTGRNATASFDSSRTTPPPPTD